MEKSRREKRKEARSAKKEEKNQSWMQHQKSQREKTFFLGDSKPKNAKKSNNWLSQSLKERSFSQKDPNSKRNESTEHSTMPKKVVVEVETSGRRASTVSKMMKRKKDLKGDPKTKFEEYLEMDMQNAAISAEEDLELERKLAKKLKVKDGKLRGTDDGISMLFEEIPSVLDSLEEGEEVSDDEGFPVKEFEDGSSSSKKRKKLKSFEPEDEIAGDLHVGFPESTETSDTEMASGEVPARVHSRKKHKKKKFSVQRQEDDMVDDTGTDVSEPMESDGAEVAVEEVPAKEPPLKGNEKYVAPHLRSRAGNESEEYAQIRRRVRGLLNKLSEANVESITGEMSTIFRSVGRSVGTQIISEEVLVSCSGGPRGNEQYAAVFAAFVAGMACLVGIDFSAKLIASLAKSFEDEYLKEDNLSLRNLTLLLSCLCIFGVCSSDLIYDFLITLSKRLMEIDVSTILTILQCCGMKIRGDDPSSMKNFILSVQNRVHELNASPGDGQDKINSKRMEFMLETICDIKNNKKRSKEDTAPHTRIKKWLQKLRVEDILIRGLKWSKLLDPDKKGQWWLSGDMASRPDNVEEVAIQIDKEVLEAQKMLQLAAAQRMNTDGRKAIFCIIMSGEDYIDAFEKLLRLDLPGKQDREIIRVLVGCCLQEKVFNKYYTVLASKLCEHDKNHKFTLQFCLWDHFKELESMQLIRLMHLAKFVAEMVVSFNLSLAVLKTVELSDSKQLTPKRIMHFRMLFEAIFEYDDTLVWNIFTRIAVNPEHETLRNGIVFFIKAYVVKNSKGVTNKFKVAKKALNNVEGVLM